jgi:hypothetical protein
LAVIDDFERRAVKERDHLTEIDPVLGGLASRFLSSHSKFIAEYDRAELFVSIHLYV